MPFTIDRSSYDKAKAYPQRHGYQLRGTAPSSIVIHSTSNPRVKDTLFTNEAKFLYKSAAISAHFLIGKDGRIVQFLDPLKYQAWHVGAAKPEYVNSKSIGIELHHSVDDPPYPKEQIEALTWLARTLMQQFSIPIGRVDTHGQVALRGPYIRKEDPSNWDYPSFLTWRTRLLLDSERVYRVAGVPIWQRLDGMGELAGFLRAGDIVGIDKTYAGGKGHLADGRGFIEMAALEEATS